MQCVNGCHFNNDCNLATACLGGKCKDPCVEFDECGTNAVCQVVSHAATCRYVFYQGCQMQVNMSGTMFL